MEDKAGGLARFARFLVPEHCEVLTGFFELTVRKQQLATPMEEQSESPLLMLGEGRFVHACLQCVDHGIQFRQGLGGGIARILGKRIHLFVAGGDAQPSFPEFAGGVLSGGEAPRARIGDEIVDRRGEAGRGRDQLPRRFADSGDGAVQVFSL